MNTNENLVSRASRRSFDYEALKNHLIEYKNKFGDLKVPYNYVCEDGYKLGYNSIKVRSNMVLLSAEQMKEIFALGFEKSMNTFDLKTFIEHLREYKNTFGDMNVSISYVSPDGYRLGRRISCLRGGVINVTPEMRKKLDEEGFIWKSRRFDFDEFLKHYKEYVENNQNEYISCECVSPDGYALGKKVAEIRNRGVKLCVGEREILDKIGFIWRLKGGYFNDFLSHLLAYKEEFGDMLVPAKYVSKDGYPLGRKVNFVRRGSVKFSDAEKKELEKHGFIWSVRELVFGEFFHELEKYKEKNGNLNYLYNHVTEEGYELGTKTVRIRMGYTKITDEQKQRLSDIGFIWNTKDVVFEKFVKRLEEYKEKYGNVQVKTTYIHHDGYHLGQELRRIKIEQKLTEEQKKVLQDLGVELKKNVKLIEKHFEISG